MPEGISLRSSKSHMKECLRCGILCVDIYFAECGVDILWEYHFDFVEVETIC